MDNRLKPLFKGQDYDEANFFLIAGPCVVENEEVLDSVAQNVSAICRKLRIPLVFKSSYRKANRTSGDSFTGIGDVPALELLASVGKKYNLPLVTDIHSAEEATMAAKYMDMLQIPAFLCRQTDLLVAAGKTGKYINVKKGQFVSGEAMKFAVEKIRHAGALFLGRYTPPAVADYMAGPNHVLPTGGTARFFSPLSVNDYVKVSNIVYYTKQELAKVKDPLMRLAHIEGFDAHAKSAQSRFS